MFFTRISVLHKLWMHACFNYKNDNMNDKQKFLKCDKCGKEFSQSQSLKEHVLFVHEGIKNHVCDSCGKAFGTSSVLKHHQKVVIFFCPFLREKNLQVL